MPGAKIPILEIEKLKFTNDGRGVEFYNDGTNFLKGRVWSGRTCSGSASGNAARFNSEGATLNPEGKGHPLFLCANSSSGWLKIHMISSSTYGPTGATYYIPIFSAVDTKSSV